MLHAKWFVVAVALIAVHGHADSELRIKCHEADRLCIAKPEGDTPSFPGTCQTTAVGLVDDG